MIAVAAGTLLVLLLPFLPSLAGLLRRVAPRNDVEGPNSIFKQPNIYRTFAGRISRSRRALRPSFALDSCP
jgi:hypothetical protein